MAELERRRVALQKDPNSAWAITKLGSQELTAAKYQAQFDALIEQYVAERRGSLPVGPDRE